MIPSPARKQLRVLLLAGWGGTGAGRALGEAAEGSGAPQYLQKVAPGMSGLPHFLQ
jgi:hypothetical protein